MAAPGVPFWLRDVAPSLVVWQPLHALVHFMVQGPCMDFGLLLPHQTPGQGIAVWCAPGEAPSETRTQRRKDQRKRCAPEAEAVAAGGGALGAGCCRDPQYAQWTVVHAVDVPLPGARGRGADAAYATASALLYTTVQLAPKLEPRNGVQRYRAAWNVLSNRGRLLGVTGVYAVLLSCE